MHEDLHRQYDMQCLLPGRRVLRRPGDVLLLRPVRTGRSRDFQRENIPGNPGEGIEGDGSCPGKEAAQEFFQQGLAFPPVLYYNGITRYRYADNDRTQDVDQSRIRRTLRSGSVCVDKERMPL